jgi:Arc/MetJ family transcription regulator
MPARSTRRPAAIQRRSTTASNACNYLTRIYKSVNLYISDRGGGTMAVTITSIRLDTRLADEAAKVLGVKSRTEAVHLALREIVALKRFKKLMTKHAARFTFAAHGE